MNGCTHAVICNTDARPRAFDECFVSSFSIGIVAAATTRGQVGRLVLNVCRIGSSGGLYLAGCQSAVFLFSYRESGLNGINR